MECSVPVPVQATIPGSVVGGCRKILTASRGHWGTTNRHLSACHYHSMFSMFGSGLIWPRKIFRICGSNRTSRTLLLLGSRESALTAVGLNCAVEFYWPFTCAAGSVTCAGTGVALSRHISVDEVRVCPYGLFNSYLSRREQLIKEHRGRRRGRIQLAELSTASLL